MIAQDTRAGILIMVLVTLIFASQDGLSAYLAERTNIFMVVTIRYWFLLVFVLAHSRLRHGSLLAVARTRQPLFQFARGALLAVEILVTVLSFTLLGLVASHAIFAMYPLLVTALSGPLLGERVGWRRWAAVAAGAVGMLVILRPGAEAVQPAALVPFLGALLFALYNIANRYAARQDGPATTFFWTAVGGAACMTAIGPFFWEPMSAGDWALMGVLCCTGATGHFLLIKAYAIAEASAIQPFAFLQLVFAAMIGVSIFGEPLPWTTVAGATIIVCAGIFALMRERQARLAAARAAGGR